MESLTRTRPTVTMAVLLTIGRAACAGRCWRLMDSAWFDVGDDRRLSVRPDDADRFRIDLWHGRRRAGTVWAAAGDWLRLTSSVEDLLSERSLA